MSDPLHTCTEGQGLDVFLIHGWGVHSGIWGSFAKALAQHYRVTCVDLPGCGRSSFDGVMDDWPRLFAAAPSNAVWIGWSLGGLMATMAALKKPERIQGLITITSSPCFMAGENWPGMRAETFDKFADALDHHYEATLERFLALQCLGMDNPKEAVRAVQERLQQFRPPQSAVLQEGLHLLKTWDLRERLSEIQCPVLHIFGRLDALVPSATVDHMSALRPSSQIITIPHASHIPFLSHPEDCLEKIRTFISTEKHVNEKISSV